MKVHDGQLWQYATKNYRLVTDANDVNHIICIDQNNIEHRTTADNLNNNAILVGGYGYTGSLAMPIWAAQYSPVAPTTQPAATPAATGAYFAVGQVYKYRDNQLTRQQGIVGQLRIVRTLANSGQRYVELSAWDYAAYSFATSITTRISEQYLLNNADLVPATTVPSTTVPATPTSPTPVAYKCNGGSKCKYHNPPKIDRWIPSIDEWDLLPDAED